MYIMENFEEFARRRLDHTRQRLALKEQQEQRLTVTHNGGVFKVDISLLAYLKTEPNSHVYLKDSYDNPIHVDRDKLLTDARHRYNEVMNDWHNQHAELKQVRRVGQLLDD